MSLRASVPFLLVIGLFGTLYFLLTSTVFSSEISSIEIPLLLDVLLVIPLLYFFSIRKQNISKITVIPIIILGVFLASYLLPIDQQTNISAVKKWLLPTLELGVLTYVISKVVKTIRNYKKVQQQTPDFYEALQTTTQNIAPKPLSQLLTMEISILYYSFIDWKKKVLVSSEFSYHETSGSQTLLYGFILVIAAEMVGIHVMLSKWNETAAWIATGISCYSALQIIGIARSIPKRPIVIEQDALILCFGIMKEARILYSEIAEIEYSTRELEFDRNTRRFSPFGLSEGHNVILRFKNPITIYGLYGIKKKCTTLAFLVDDLPRFKVQWHEFAPGVCLHSETH